MSGDIGGVFSLEGKVFNLIRYSLGVNKALFNLYERGLISDDLRKEMLEVASNDENRAYGVILLKSKAVASKADAAATVFARLSVCAERTPTGRVTADNWQYACRQALVDGGAPFANSFLAVAELKRLIIEAEKNVLG